MTPSPQASPARRASEIPGRMRHGHRIPLRRWPHEPPGPIGTAEQTFNHPSKRRLPCLTV